MKIGSHILTKELNYEDFQTNKFLIEMQASREET